MTLPTFSESWHRVADQRCRLRPDVRIRRQVFRGERWHVVEDPLANRYFRIRPEAYEFLVRLSPDRAVDDVWRECLDLHPQSAPGQQECIQLLSQLYQANLLHYDLAADAEELFRRQKERKDRELKARLLGIMFARIPLVDPDRFLQRLLPFFGWCVGKVGLLLWLIVIALGGKSVMDHWPQALAESRHVIDTPNLLLLYVALIGTKLLHELGHGLFCRKYGGEVHTLGVMFLIFTPVPYVDVTSSWSFRNRWQRILVASAGMMVENFVAGLAAIIWARSAPGPIHAVCYNIMFVASVSTLIFNLNPLLRFDGYYIFSDLIDVPNLYQRSLLHLKHWWKRHVFGVRKSRSPAITSRERRWLGFYGVLSGIYRVLVFAGVLLFVADTFLILGILMAVACIIGWILLPAFRLVRYLAQSPELDQVRPRAWLAVAGLTLGLLAFLQFVPFPAHIRAHGVVEAKEFREVVTEAPGFVRNMPTQPDLQVQPRTTLMRLENEELTAALDQAASQLAEIDARLSLARVQDPAALEALEKRAIAARQRHAELEADERRLTVSAGMAGVWSFLPPGSLTNYWMPRGSSLGLIIQPDSWRFVAAVRQADADFLFGHDLSHVEVRLAGQAGAIMESTEWQVVPGGRLTLPSVVLGTRGGGEIAVQPDDPRGRQAVEPFYLVRLSLPADAAASLRHGQPGQVRFRTGWEPLLPRWIRRLRQFLQERYRL